MSEPRRPPPTPPRPDLVRRPRGAFGWLDAQLLHDGWLADLGPRAVAVLVLLMLAADRRGASYYGRERMADLLGMSRADIDDALNQLLDAGLVEYRPWRQGGVDGVWQLVPVTPRHQAPRQERALSAAELLRGLGFAPPHS